MLRAIADYLGPASLVPQGYCLLWRQDLVTLHAVSDIVLAVAFVIIPAGLWHFARHRTDLEFRGLFLLFAAVILLTGITHLIDMITTWMPIYGAHGVMKALTATVAVAAAYVLWPAIPKALSAPTLASLRDANREMAKLVTDRDAMLAACNAELTAANRELDAFTYTISHDLRRPLTSINAYGAKLAETHGGQLDAAGRELLERIRQTSITTGALIDDLIHMSRLTRVPLQMTSVDLSAMAADIIKELQRAEPDRVVTVLIAEGATAECDRDLMRLALAHLLKNAWKFTSKQENAKIEFGYQRRGTKTMYYIRDNGVGFDMAHAGRLFLPFRRLHEATEFSGTGIGLAVVARIIHRHGGDIKAEASLGKGTSITFSL
ncbi:MULTISPECIES: ATP-binding protein [Rhodomicrobium]|uniref:sensor histidine kinase n=1 Tax=Rhodomicrobium TaxID=1068 RepID=UPI000B4AD6B5|nr:MULTISPECIES: ATP-binding protein [Rhodomicrobium]